MISLVRYVVVVMLFGILFSSCSINTEDIEDPSELKRYDIETALIVYKFGGNVTGTKSVYFDRWGMREYWIISTKEKVIGMVLARSIENLHVPFLSLEVDKADMVARKIDTLITDVGISSNWAQTKFYKEKEYIESGGEKLKAERVAGYLCDVWKFEGRQIWVWKGIVLKEITVLQNTSTVVEARNIIFNPGDLEHFFEIEKKIIIMED